MPTPGLTFAKSPDVMSHLRARATETLFNFSAVLLIVSVIALFDDEVRQHAGNLIGGNLAAELGIVAAPANRLTRIAFEAFGDYSSGNGTLVGFGAAGLVLLAFMFRS